MKTRAKKQQLYLSEEGYKMLFTMPYGARLVLEDKRAPLDPWYWPSPPSGWQWYDDDHKPSGAGSTVFRKWFWIVRRQG